MPESLCLWCQKPSGTKSKTYCSSECRIIYRRMMNDRTAASRRVRELVEAHLEADALAAMTEGDTDRLQRRSRELRQLRKLELDETATAGKSFLDRFKEA